KALDTVPNDEVVNFFMDVFNKFNFTLLKDAVVNNYDNIELSNANSMILCGEEYFIRGYFDYALLHLKKALEAHPITQ
ncbi:13025_t:CDS:1, partial [Racocetra fulgida]